MEKESNALSLIKDQIPAELISDIQNTSFDASNPMASIDQILKNTQFKEMLNNLSGTLGVDSNDISSTLDDPNFSQELSNMASNIDMSKLANMAGGLLNIDPTQINSIKDTLSQATNHVKDLVSKPSNITISIDISASDSYKGIRKKITVKRLRYDSSKHAFVQEKQKLVLNIPSGTRSGKKFDINNEGDEYFNTQEQLCRSNLEITINVEDHEKFTLVGNDLYYHLNVSIQDFLNDKYYDITFIDSEVVTLFKPKEFKFEGRLVGIVKGLGMPPEFIESNSDQTNDELDNDSNKDTKEITIGNLIILFNIKFKGNSNFQETAKLFDSSENQELSAELFSTQQKNNCYPILEYKLNSIIL